jgi:hypothetical protein
MAINVPQKSITYIIICSTIIIILLFVGIYPLHRAMANRDEKIADMNLKLQEQNLLLPVYQMLKQRAGKKSAHMLPLPTKAQLPSDQMGRLEGDLKDVSGKAKVELVSFQPALNVGDGKAKTISVDAVARGEFFAMRKFLIGLGSIPYVENIEEVQLSRTADWLEIKVKFWVARS